jgi:hypothetical protein
MVVIVRCDHGNYYKIWLNHLEHFSGSSSHRTPSHVMWQLKHTSCKVRLPPSYPFSAASLDAGGQDKTLPEIHHRKMDGASGSHVAVENLVKKYTGRAGLHDVTPHPFRHTFGKSLVDAGIDRGTVATCVPCRVGTVRQEEALTRLLADRPLTSHREELALIAEIGQAMRDASICGLGQTASSAVESAINNLDLFQQGANP